MKKRVTYVKRKPAVLVKNRRTYSDDWEIKSKLTKQQAGYTCVKCKRHKKELAALGIRLNADHRKRLADGGTNDDTNLRCVCEECHANLPRHQHMKKKTIYRAKGPTGRR